MDMSKRMGSKIKSILTADQFSKTELDNLLNMSEKIEAELETRKSIPLLKDHILAALFFEPSTRTRLSFESAMHRLGGKVITAVGMQFSSLAKGETLYDTLKVMESYADVVAIRHPVVGASSIAAQSISVPVINAGDGAGEHPTQGILDLYTIHKRKNLSASKNINIGFIGDIKYGRTIHSLVKLLWHYNVNFTFISPPELALPTEYEALLQEKNASYSITDNIEEIYNCDVAYITRIQEERFPDRSEYEKFRDSFVINKELILKCKEDIILMHPLPRLNEISTDVDGMPQAIYFEQAQNGLYTRMALLSDILGCPMV